MGFEYALTKGNGENLPLPGGSGRRGGRKSRGQGWGRNRFKTLILVSSLAKGYESIAIDGQVVLIGLPGWSYVEFARDITAEAKEGEPPTYSSFRLLRLAPRFNKPKPKLAIKHFRQLVSQAFPGHYTSKGELKCGLEVVERVISTIGGNDMSNIITTEFRSHTSEEVLILAIKVVKDFLLAECNKPGRKVVLCPPLPRHHDRFIGDVSDTFPVTITRVWKRVNEEVVDTNCLALDRHTFNLAQQNPHAYHDGTHVYPQLGRKYLAQPLIDSLSTLYGTCEPEPAANSIEVF